ncbi:MAG TPA: SDR family NAD(P)-dependent oxidoreductase [Candidatus Sulfomarinibacteraceae bacterium]|nr:SDR family NAD(P)-dependent oxidoreductase [Candidatus Sulfomarinibacteraceae bacterium]
MNQQHPNEQRPLEPQGKAIVIGASSGIGAALLQDLVRQGYTVAGLARREDRLNTVVEQANQMAGAQRALAYEHDVTSFDEAPSLFQEIVQDLGGLDLIVYVAGVQPPVAPNEYNFDKDAAMVGVNLLGAMAWLNQAAQRFHETGAGHIVGVSSISGDRGRSAFPGYHTSKGALSIYLESLRNRLSRRGATVTTVKPGFVDTPLLANADKTFWVISPQEAARLIVEAIHDGKQVAYIPGRWRWISLVISNIPSFIFRRLNL